MHLYFHPVESWLLLSAYLTVGGESCLVMPHQIILDPPDPDLALLAPRLWAEERQP